MRPLRSVSKHIPYYHHYKSSFTTPIIHNHASINHIQTFHAITRRFATTPTAKTASSISLIPSQYKPDQRILNLFYGFLVGVAFTGLYNREWPGYERRIRRKANKGNASAMVEYGELLLSKKETDSGSERNIARAFKLFQMASEQGNKTGHYYLGLLHKMEKIQAPNPKAAYHHFSVASNEHDEGDPNGTQEIKTINETLRIQSKYELGLCYLEGYGADRDIKMGLDILENIAKTNGDAAFMLSQIYVNGRYGVSVNSIKSVSWKKESAKLGNKIAIEQMNELYLSKGRDLIDEEVPNINAYDEVKRPTS